MKRKSIFERTLLGIGARRYHRRYKVPVDVMVIPFRGDGDAYWAMAEDVSARGVFIRTTRRLAIDTLLLLKLVIEGQPQPLRVKAKVVHRVGGVGFGCRFVDMAPATASFLSHLVAQTAAAPVARSIN